MDESDELPLREDSTEVGELDDTPAPGQPATEQPAESGALEDE